MLLERLRFSASLVLLVCDAALAPSGWHASCSWPGNATTVVVMEGTLQACGEGLCLGLNPVRFDYGTISV